MPAYDCRKEGREPGAISFPCAVRIVNPVNDERIPDVFFASTAPLAKIGRFVRGADGDPIAAERKKRWVSDGRGGKKIEIYYTRLETWEFRPWLAVSVATGEVVVRSHPQEENNASCPS